MSETHNKLDFIKNKIGTIDEVRLKNLEARFIGPSSNGNLPAQYEPLLDIDVDILKTKFSNKSDNNTINESQKELFTLNIEQAHNSNKSINNSHKKKTPPIKAEKKTKISANGNFQINFLTAKRNRSEPVIEDNYNEKTEIIDNIEFSSKNVISSTQLFKSKENNSSNLNNFINSNSSKKTNKEFKEKIIPNNLNNKIIQSSETKINDYFKGNNDDNNPTIKTITDKLTRVLNENEKLHRETFEKNKQILEKEKENDKLRIKSREDEETIRNYTILNKQYDNQLLMSKQSLVKYLRELEEYKRIQKKHNLNEQSFKIGKFTVQRAGNQIIEVWEEGDDFIKVKNKLQKLLFDKDELEKVRSKLNQIFRNAKKHNNDNNSLDNSEMYEINEQKELINFKLNSLNEEEKELKVTLDRYEIDKINYQIEYKRLLEEEKCRYGFCKSKERWPVLSNKYLLLSLLGKGGYSEVYKAYDLENNIEVACKIHQLNPQWSQTIKENYIKHTIRENQIHKEINHPKVVRHYDTIEIDDCSFCTVLELCSGPDLYTYLKIHKTLSEKESRFIICQILSGLEYLNKQSRKIIHYDLKPQNILFHNMEVKISDFGLAKVIEDNSDKIELTSQGVGTYWYLPPECFEQFDKSPPVISNKVDIWSIGVILYELIFGRRPFGHSMTQDRILKEGVIINAKSVDFPSNIKITDECKDFIKRCLAYNQIDRLDIFEAIEHSFINNRNKKNK